MRALVLSFALALPLAVPAIAHDHDWPLPEEIAIEEALSIARAEGLVLIREIEFDDGRWDVEGRDADGRQIEIEIDGVTGEIVSFDR